MKRTVKILKNTWLVVRDTVKEFIDDEPMNYGAVIAFYTIFSLPAVLIIMIRIAGIAFGEEAVQEQLANEVTGLLGRESATQVQRIIQNAELDNGKWIATIVGIGTLVFSATTVFVALQNSLNRIWSVKPKPEKGWLKVVINRVLSFALVVTFAFLLLVSLLLDTLLGLFQGYIDRTFSEFTSIFLFIGNNIISLGIVTFIFAIVFKVLPDAKIKWRDVWMGAFVTTLLFVVGKFLIGFYLGNSDLGSTYGAAGSMILLLVWVYYSSTIVLLGAEFTKVFSRFKGRGIKPASHAVKVEIKEIEKENQEVNR